MGLAQADPAAATHPAGALWQASLLATGLPLPVVQAAAQELAWLAQANPLQKPYTLAIHCLCAPP